jgi:hypothetical protein
VRQKAAAGRELRKVVDAQCEQEQLKTVARKELRKFERMKAAEPKGDVMIPRLD